MRVTERQREVGEQRLGPPGSARGGLWSRRAWKPPRGVRLSRAMGCRGATLAFFDATLDAGLATRGRHVGARVRRRRRGHGPFRAIGPCGDPEALAQAAQTYTGDLLSGLALGHVRKLAEVDVWRRTHGRADHRRRGDARRRHAGGA